MCIIVDLKVKFLVVKRTLTGKNSFLTVSYWQRNDAENSEVPFR